MLAIDETKGAMRIMVAGLPDEERAVLSVALEGRGFLVIGADAEGPEPDAVIVAAHGARRRADLSGIRTLHPVAPVLAVVDRDDPRAFSRARAAGACDCLRAPLDPDEVLVRLETQLRLAHLDREKRELQRALKMLALPFDRSQVPILIIDALGRVFRGNAAARRALGLEDLAPGKDILALSAAWRWWDMEGHELAVQDQPLFKALGGEPIRGALGRIERRDGTESTHFIEAIPLRSAEGEIIGGYIAFADITERVAADAQRREQETRVMKSQKLESLGILAGGVAHDFNNLLVGALGNAELLLMDRPLDDPDRPLIEEILEVSSRAAELSRQMLAYSGRGRLAEDQVDLAEVADQTVQILHTSIGSHIQVVCELDEVHNRIRGDEAQLRQVVMNLLLNANEALGDERGTITMRVQDLPSMPELTHPVILETSTSEGPCLLLEVADTGPGLDPEIRDRIFEPFFTTRFAGRGLGLPAVLGIVRGHSGQIEVLDQPGGGVCFRAFLPANTQDDAAVELLDGQSPLDLNGKVALLVDDEPIVRRVGQRLLEALGMRVVTARDGQAAVEVFSANPSHYDVAIDDLTMPRMSGPECCRVLRELRPDQRIIISSGFGLDNLSGRFGGMKLQGSIQKPYELGRLQDALFGALGE